MTHRMFTVTVLIVPALLETVLRERMDDEDLDVDRMADALAMSRATLYACGFKTVPHFTRRFKEQFGRTPAAYRKREAHA